MKYRTILILLFLSVIAQGKESKFTIKSFSTNDDGMIDKISIIYYQDINITKNPVQVILDDRTHSHRVFSDLKLIETNSDYKVFSFTLTLDDYELQLGPSPVISTVENFTWPYNLVKKSGAFIPILISDRCVIGFANDVVSNDEYVKKWFESKRLKSE
ncbi:MAG: hypothetical protein V4727_10920 [Verrucomicrobiota bacterium]